jgi:hypothetical protein
VGLRVVERGVVGELEVQERRAGSSNHGPALCRRRRSDRGYYAFLFPSLPILLRLLGVFVVFGPDHDFTNSICLQQLLGVLCWARP